MFFFTSFCDFLKRKKTILGSKNPTNWINCGDFPKREIFVMIGLTIGLMTLCHAQGSALTTICHAHDEMISVVNCDCLIAELILSSLTRPVIHNYLQVRAHARPGMFSVLSTSSASSFVTCWTQFTGCVSFGDAGNTY